MLEGKARAARPARARPAASLVCIWHDAEQTPHLWMGQRADGMRFLPGVLVFPGGRVERYDSLFRSGGLLGEEDAAALDGEAPRLLPAHAFVQAGLRECLEETGLDAAAWLSGALRYVARAITPADLPTRYDARFLLAQLAQGEPRPAPTSQGDGELGRVGWYGPADLMGEKLHPVTRLVLEHCLAASRGVPVGQPPDRLLVAGRRPGGWMDAAPVASRPAVSREPKPG
jgi:8-oxo-dGTP pyrophosphatase MutT (NUDIX family)